MLPVAKYLAIACALALITACASKDAPSIPLPPTNSVAQTLFRTEITRVENKAADYLAAEPLTVIAFVSEHSAIRPHDFYASDAFVAHRKALVRFSDIVATLTSAFLVNGDLDYAEAAIKHLRAWFMEPATRMNPNLRYAQGIMDTAHLTEVARSVKLLSAYNRLSPAEEKTIKGWFAHYLAWLSGKEKPHTVWWTMQAAAIADLLGDKERLAQIRANFKQHFTGEMLATDGSFAAEPAHSRLILNALATVAQIASTDTDNLWRYRTEGGRGMARTMQRMLPQIRENRSARQPSLIFAALAYNNRDYLSAWQSQEVPQAYTAQRNHPVRYPLLWLENNMPKAAELEEETKPKAPAKPVKVASS